MCDRCNVRTWTLWLAWMSAAFSLIGLSVVWVWAPRPWQRALEDVPMSDRIPKQMLPTVPVEVKP